MRYLSFARIRKEVLKAGDQPRKTAFSVGLGVWLAFSPFPGLHLISGFVLSRFLRLNPVIVLAVALIHNPWTMIAIHLAGLAVGDLVLTGDLASLDSFRAFPWRELGPNTIFASEFWSENWPYLRNILWPFMLGSLMLSFSFGGIAYGLALRYIRRKLAEGVIAP